jgi:peptidyl-prolyl cis-trans isomerase SurA
MAPQIPAVPSRPTAWPTSGAAAETVKGVLSSIRARPGEPLAEEATSLLRHEGVVQAQYIEATPPVPIPRQEVASLEAALVVARVGPEVVLEADLLTPKALEWLAQVTPGMPPEKVRELRLQICKQVIDQHVESLLVYVDACREIPPDKLPEIRKNVDQAFNENQLPLMMQEEGVANSLEFERLLRSRGSSLDRMRKMFFERGLAQEWLRKNTGGTPEIPHADLIAWYQNHLEDYDIPARAKFEVVTVKTGLKRSRAQAWDIIAAMGNEILGGRPFAEVARARSEGPTAAAGGTYDWTTKGSLSAKKIDEAIFSLPVGELSAIIEDGEALHIVRVTDRELATRTPFIEAQVEIRQKLIEQKRKAAMDEYLAKLRARTPVWTVFDDPGGNANDPVFTAGRPDAGDRQ